MRCNPARLNQLIANVAGKRNIEQIASVKMTKFPLSQPKLYSAKTVGPGGNPSHTATV